MIETHKEIYAIYSKGELLGLSDDYIKISYSTENLETVKRLGVTYEIIQSKELHLDRVSFPISIFEKRNEFLKIPVVKKTQKSNNILILNNDNQALSFIGDETFVNFTIEEKNYFFTNAISYVTFLDLLKSKDTEDENAFHFIDYFNRDNNQIVLTSLSEKGRVIIKFDNEIPTLNPKTNHQLDLINFTKCFDDKQPHLPKFLKNSLIEFAVKHACKERLENIFLGLSQIIENAKVNFEIYINNLSIDKIKNEYDEFKSKYFAELSDILTKLSHKIIGLPLGITASLFAIESVKHNNGFLFFLLFAIIVTGFYLILLLRINFKDLNFVYKIYLTDFKKLKDNDFFKKYPSELKNFEDIKNRITDRLKHLYLIAESYFWVLNISNLALISIIMNYLSLKTELIGIIILLKLFIITLVRNKIIENGSA